MLEIAEHEAERSHHTYIGSEHLVLALLHQRSTVASATLSRLGVSQSAVRAVIEIVLGHSARIKIDQITPTARVNKIIELALREAQIVGSTHVGTDHVLLGILVEGHDLGAHVLEDLGANLYRVRKTLQAVHQEGGISDAWRQIKPAYSVRARHR
jgi:ATP-dependent Clp protease ATP-binding subunit ClpC